VAQGASRSLPATVRHDLDTPSGAPARCETPPVTSTDEPSSVTIVRSRYGGAYEQGKWIAFPLQPSQLPDDWTADDVTCARFFHDSQGEVGGGDSPQAAYEDLLRILRERRASL
jgi:hypothetical protein